MANVSSSNGLEKRPKLRFPGFDEPWCEVKIKDIFRVTRGSVLAADKVLLSKIDGYEYPVYSSQTKADGLLGYYNTYLYENAITWTTDGANAGTVHYRAGKFYCTNVCGVLLNKDGYANRCTAAILGSISKKYVSYVGNPKLMNNIMSEIPIIIPALEEQHKIDSFIAVLDKRIKAQQMMITSLKKYKRGVVSSILTHQIKFADSEGKPYPEWTSCTLQDAVVFLDGQRKPLESADRAKRQGQYPYYGASGIIDYIDDYIFDEPLLLLGEDGANILNRSTPLCFIATGKYWVNNHAHVMRPKSGQNIKFLCELLESLDYTRYNTGTAQPKINQEKCREIKLSLPVYEEQCRIASFLATLDRRLERAQSNLNYLLLIRDGLLQQLFI